MTCTYYYVKCRSCGKNAVPRCKASGRKRLFGDTSMCTHGEEFKECPSFIAKTEEFEALL